ncbi:Bromodomain domain containing protein [Trichuris trichiura]|uniref:Bromodomain domain containing protein n=1 Tax=Trichuris trichiura TaxID=36087 RepID=A0A077ZFR1_TRITR|nr:Bromodomain domain containing protein [Trichuris trichiura]
MNFGITGRRLKSVTCEFLERKISSTFQSSNDRSETGRATKVYWLDMKTSMDIGYSYHRREKLFAKETFSWVGTLWEGSKTVSNVNTGELSDGFVELQLDLSDVVTANPGAEKAENDSVRTVESTTVGADMRSLQDRTHLRKPVRLDDYMLLSVDAEVLKSSMADRLVLNAEDFVDTPFPRDYWRAFDNFVLSSLVLCCEPPLYEATDWEKICETLQERTNTEFKPGYLNALSCELQYGVLEGYIVRLHMKANKAFGTHTEIGQLVRDIFYLKFLKQEGPKLRRVLATYGVWQDVLRAIEEKRLPPSAGISFGKEAAEKIREAMAFKCPCEPIVIGLWWQEIEIDDDLVKPVPEEVVLKLIAEENNEDAGGSESAAESVAEELSTPSTVAHRAASVDRTKMMKNLLLLLDIAYEHKDYSIFLRPVTGIPAYDRIVRRPVCLTDIKRDIRNGKISSIPALRKRLVLMFNNAFFFNSVFDPLYERMILMCVDVMNAFDERVAIMQSE